MCYCPVQMYGEQCKKKRCESTVISLEEHILPLLLLLLLLLLLSLLSLLSLLLLLLLLLLYYDALEILLGEITTTTLGQQHIF